EIAQAACRPQKRRHRVASRRGRDQSLQVPLQRRILVDLALASSTRLAHPPRRRAAPRTNVLDPSPDRGPRKPADPRQRAYSAMAQRQRFHRRITAKALLIQNRLYLPKPFISGADLFGTNHLQTLEADRPRGNPAPAIPQRRLPNMI